MTQGEQLSTIMPSSTSATANFNKIYIYYPWHDVLYRIPLITMMHVCNFFLFWYQYTRDGESLLGNLRFFNKGQIKKLQSFATKIAQCAPGFIKLTLKIQFNHSVYAYRSFRVSSHVQRLRLQVNLRGVFYNSLYRHLDKLVKGIQLLPNETFLIKIRTDDNPTGFLP